MESELQLSVIPHRQVIRACIRHLINLKQSFVLCLSAVGHPITFLNMYSVLKKTVRMTLDACESSAM